MTIQQPLSDGWQAWYDPATDVLYVDSRLGPADVRRCAEQAHHHLLGYDDLAPDVDVPTPRPRLRCLPGGREQADAS